MNNCKFCKELIDELTEKEYEFTPIDINKDEYRDEWLRTTRLTLMPMTPTVKINDDILCAGRDFRDAAHFIKILENIDVHTNLTLEERIFSIESSLKNLQMTVGRINTILSRASQPQAPQKNIKE